MIAYQKPFFDKSGLGYTVESSSSANVSKEMKFVKAKEPMVATPIVEKVKVEKKTNVIAQRVLTKPPNPRLKGNLFQSHKEVLKLNIFSTTVKSEDTLDLIATSFKH